MKIKVGVSPQLGIRGVLANTDIDKGEIIERCPIIFSPIKQEKLIEQTIFNRYIFEWNNKFDCLVLGYGSLYNHSYQPNADFFREYKKKLMKFIAIKDIKKGEELTINYNGFPEIKDKLEDYYLDFANL